MTLTRFGLLTTNYSYGLPSDRIFERVLDIARAAEASAFDTLWLPDHLVQGPVGDVAANRGEPLPTMEGPNGTTSPMFDAPTLLCALAATTTRLRIGPLVSPVTTRHPAVLAKSITTVDVVSHGRAILGMGAAWDPDEHRRYGLPYPVFEERLGRLEDAVQICRAMLDNECASYTGNYYSIDEAINMPRPVSPRIPILVGGHSSRSLRIAARYGDACNPIGNGDMLRQAFATLEAHCEDEGRDPNEIARPAGIMFHRREDLHRQVADAFSAGCDGVILIPWQLALMPEEIMEIGEGLAREFGTEERTIP